MALHYAQRQRANNKGRALCEKNERLDSRQMFLDVAIPGLQSVQNQFLEATLKPWRKNVMRQCLRRLM